MRVAYICADPGVPVFGLKGCSIHVQEMLRALSHHGAQIDLFATNVAVGAASPPRSAVPVAARTPLRQQLAPHLTIVLVDDAEIADLNRQFHDTAGPTDILTFHYPDLAGGELVISVERAVEQARRYRTTPSRELALYVVHGILHLHGYDDRTATQRRRMRAAERRLLGQVGRVVAIEKLLARRAPARLG